MNDATETSESVVFDDCFWRWFKETFSSLSPTDVRSDDRLRKELDTRVKQLGVPGWEVGPFGGDLSYFALSPAGDREKLERTLDLASSAPVTPGWIALGAKPAKKWDRVFFWGDEELNASSWKLLVYSFDDGKVDIVFVDPAMEAFSSDRRLAIMVMLIASELGEQAMIERVNALEYNEITGDELEASTITLRDLRKVLDC